MAAYSVPYDLASSSFSNSSRSSPASGIEADGAASVEIFPEVSP